MKHNMSKSALPGIFNSPLTKEWIPAILLAITLNLSMVCLMPGLIKTVPDKPEDLDALNAVSVFRVKRNISPVRKKALSKPEKPEKKIIKKDPVYVAPSVQKKIRLPFKLNTRLPVGPQSLALPSLDMLALNAPDLAGAYDSTEIDAPLTPISKVPPMYPMRAKRMSVEGWVSVCFLVNDSGTVEQIKVLAAEPEGIFEQSVMRCISKWRFQPGTIEGEPVNTWVETTVHFKLEDGS